MENYFINCFNVEQTKKRFRELAFKYHSDITGGNDEIMKIINSQYHSKLESLNNTQSKNDDGSTFTYNYDYDVEKQIMDKLSDILKLKLKDIDIMLVGRWLWLGGNTKENKDVIKENGFKWHNKRLLWYFNPLPYQRSFSKKSFESIALKYGYKKYSSTQETGIVTA